ncbi:hypothetical protein EVA_17474, partial [gut metagenome]
RLGATGKNLSVATGFVAAETSVSKYGRTTFESTGIVWNTLTGQRLNPKPTSILSSGEKRLSGTVNV